jgi:ABC-2 type transport system permease protein
MTGRRQSRSSMVAGYRVAWGIGLRGTRAWIMSPPFFVITMLFPLIFLAAFSGALSPLFYVEGFSYSQGYTAFVYGFVILQAAAFGGIFTGYSTARDWDIGFAPRLFLATPRRAPIIAGYVAVAVIRSLIAGTVLTAAVLVAGMKSHAGFTQGALLVAMVIVVAMITSLWACGVAMRIRATRGGPLMYTPILVVLFATPVYVPRSLLHGWLGAVVQRNPMTYMVEGSRSLLAGADQAVARGLAFGAVLLALALVWAILGVRHAERSSW